MEKRRGNASHIQRWNEKNNILRTDYCRNDRGQWDLIELPPEDTMNISGQASARCLCIRSRLPGVLPRTPVFNALSTEERCVHREEKSDAQTFPCLVRHSCSLMRIDRSALPDSPSELRRYDTNRQDFISTKPNCSWQEGDLNG